MGCTCTCPKANDHAAQHLKKQLTNDQDEKQNQHSDAPPKQQQGPALVCTFGNVINGMVPFCIENLSAAIYETVEIFNLDTDTYYNRWNIHLFIASNTNCNKYVTRQLEWQKYTRNVIPKTKDNNYFIKVPFFFSILSHFYQDAIATYT